MAPRPTPPSNSRCVSGDHGSARHVRRVRSTRSRLPAKPPGRGVVSAFPLGRFGAVAVVGLFGMGPGDVALAALRRRLAIEDHGAETDAAEQFALRFGRPRLGPARAACEIDAQQIAGKAAGARGRLGLPLGTLRRGRGCGTHTATGVSPGAFDGRPRMVSGSKALVVLVAMKAGLMSNGFALRCAFQRPSPTPDWTSPLSMPTSLVVQMSLDGPRMIAPTSRSPRQRSLRYASRSALTPDAVSALASSQAPNDATSRWQTSTMLMMRLPRYETALPAILAPTTRPCSCAVGSIACTAFPPEIRSRPSATSPAAYTFGTLERRCSSTTMP